MKAVILGTCGYGPSDRGHTSCIMLPELGLVLDAGSGLYRMRNLLQTSTLDIFLSHAHLDHLLGLSYLDGILWGKEVELVRIHGEADKLAAIQRYFFAPELGEWPPKAEWLPLQPKEELPDGGQLSYFQLEHRGGCVGYRLDWPEHSLAYVTDTHAHLDAAYIDKIRGVDLLLHECYLPDDMAQFAREIGHSCITPVAQVAAAAGVGHLVLVHLLPFPELGAIDVDIARAIFPSTEMGYDGLELEF
jgi:ribonuclease Z